MRTKSWMVAAALALCVPAVVSAQVKAETDQRYVVLEVVKLNTLAAELNSAAQQGFRLRMSAVEGARVMGLMERVATPPDVYEYRIVATFSNKTGDKEMNAAAAEGFRVVPHTLMVKKGITIFNIDNVVIMEKEPRAAGVVEYRTLETARSSTLQKELKAAVDEGWRAVDLVHGQVLLERMKTAGSSTQR